jgi:hypothetical protein
MSKKTEPWYIHAGLWVVIAILVVVLIQVALIEPTEIIRTQEYNKNEARLRMINLKQAEILYEQKYDRFTDNLDTLINFIRNDSGVLELVSKYDTLKIYTVKGDSTVLKSKNPFVDLISVPYGAPTFYDSLYITPISGRRFIVQIDTLVEVDTVINRRGRIVKIDSTTTIGKRYLIKNPDSDDKIGDVNSDALLNTESWE